MAVHILFEYRVVMMLEVSDFVSLRCTGEKESYSEDLNVFMVEKVKRLVHTRLNGCGHD